MKAYPTLEAFAVVVAFAAHTFGNVSGDGTVSLDERGSHIQDRYMTTFPTRFPVGQPTDFPTSRPTPFPTVPIGYTCPAPTFNSNDGCDCECGAEDPDCRGVTSESSDCQAGSVCFRGQCVLAPTLSPTLSPVAPTIPPQYTCPAPTFASNDGCNCECGAIDPDCRSTISPSSDCASGFVCNAGNCVLTPTSAPSHSPTTEPPTPNPTPQPIPRTPPTSQRNGAVSVQASIANTMIVLLGSVLSHVLL